VTVKATYNNKSTLFQVGVRYALSETIGIRPGYANKLKGGVRRDKWCGLSNTNADRVLETVEQLKKLGLPMRAERGTRPYWHGNNNNVWTDPEPPSWLLDPILVAIAKDWRAVGPLLDRLQELGLPLGDWMTSQSEALTIRAIVRVMNHMPTTCTEEEHR
jgi:hypothetical protein